MRRAVCTEARKGRVGAGNGVRIDAVSCMRCEEKWLRVSLMDCGEEVLTRDVFPEGEGEKIFEKILARAFCADSIKE